jgi:hypothetical protein
MTDFDRNIRTLIVCFVLALMFLVPMAILENNREVKDRIRVLGETKNVIKMEKVVDEVENRVILPEVGGFKR